MAHLYVAVLVVIVAALLAVAIHRTYLVKTKADYLAAGRVAAGIGETLSSYATGPEHWR